jgi:DNA-binding NarL/FixJ family response regulator
MSAGLTIVISRQQGLRFCGIVANQKETLNSVRRTEADVAVLNLSGLLGSIRMLRNLKSKAPHLRLIVVANDKEQPSPARALRAGVHGYLSSHDTQHALIEAVRRTVEGEIYLGPEAAITVSRRVATRCRSSRVAPAHVEDLTNREFDVFCLLGQGRGSLQIAKDLGVGLRSVKTYCTQIKHRLGLRDQREVLRAAIQYRNGIQRYHDRFGQETR